MKRKSRNKNAAKKTTATPIKNEPVTKSTAITTRRQQQQEKKLSIKSEENNNNVEVVKKEPSVVEETASTSTAVVKQEEERVFPSPTSASSPGSLNVDNNSSSSPSSSTQETTYLIVELRLISIDFAAKRNDGDEKEEKDGDKKLQQRAKNDEKDENVSFLCVNACAMASHLVGLVVKMMTLDEAQFDVVLMCNGYEVKPQCPLTILKNKFFSDKDTIKIYYAIVEKKVP